MIKWYWIILIVALALIVGYLIAKQTGDKSPLKKNTQVIADTLINEAKEIDRFFTGRPNLTDPNYQITADAFNKRKAEILLMLKNMYGCVTEYDYNSLKCI